MGRLGNQMFQYACAYSLAKKHQTTIAINTHDSYRNSRVNQIVETFELQSAVYDQFDEIKYKFNEASFEYDYRIEDVPNDTDIVGYFQSEKYFKNVRQDLVTREFRFRNIFEKDVESFQQLHGIVGTTCSIHIRKGDYKHLSDVHTNLDISYYADAIKKVPVCSHYIVFSDDPEEASRMISPISSLGSIDFVYPELGDSSSMLLMSLCDHHIIANSSFSWWGAWLSQKKGVVIAPRKWFGPKGPSAWSDVYCETWKAL